MAKAKKKYELTDETMVVGGITLHRIRALVAIAVIGVAAGDLGGWIEREDNLSQVSGNAWVYGNARVYGDAQVYGPIICATRTDGYTFCVAHDHHYIVRIIAGCRYLTPDEARRHWTETRGGTRLGDESLALIDHLERMAKLQGWPTPESRL